MERVDIKNLKGSFLDGGGEKYIYFYNGKPFTGIAVEYYYEVGSVVLGEEEYHNGYQDGWIRYYHRNGKLDTEYKNINNRTVPGTYKEYDENGVLIHEM